jgi:spermidine/putrescine ABC transporter ATP-binding subunit
VATVELTSVRKAYHGPPAVDGLTLSVGSGERLALLGPSGCGKTTTLNMIAGFLEPDAGTITIGGAAMVGVPPHRRNTGMVFQNYALFPHLTVFDNLAFGLVMRRVARAEVAARVREVLDLVRLPGLERRFPRELSGGQQQRVALARALVIRPAVLLLDEPLSNLDARLRQDMRFEIVEIQRRLGITTLFVTHDQEEALAIADRIAVMNGGRIEQLDAPAAVYGRPATEFVARFIGEANFLPGRVRESAGERVVVDADGGHVLRVHDRARPAGARVTVMVRPEKVVLGPDGRGLDNALPAVVRGISFLGAATRVQLVAGDLSLTASVGDTAPLGALSPGDKVVVGWRAGDALLLDTGP